MNSIIKLTEIFSQFPGIGPRQAKRFVYHLLLKENGDIEELIKNLQSLKKNIAICKDCKRFFEEKHGRSACRVCTDQSRDFSVLMVLPRDIDLESVEKNGSFNGMYFVLGGVVPILEKNPEKKIRIKDLITLIEKKEFQEIILAMNWNPEGENTADYLEKQLKSMTESRKIKITHLGKGLSMGTELEYVDPDTLKNALKNRA